MRLPTYLALSAALALATPGTALAMPGTAPAYAAHPAHPATTAADEPAAWGLKPADTAHGAGRPNYAYGAKPGDVLQDAVVVTNHAREPLTLSLYAADGFTTSTGLLDVLPADRPSRDLGTWTRLRDTTLTLAPGASATVPFTITIPADARPGDHTGAVVTSLRTATTDRQISLDRRLASRIHVRVAGDLKVSAAVSAVTAERTSSWVPFSPNDITVRYRLTNTGNTRIYAQESGSAQGPFGLAGVHSPRLDLPEVLPGSTVERTVVLRSVSPLGASRVSLDVVPVGVGIGGGSAEPVHASSWLLALSWQSIVLIALLAGAVAGWLARGRLRRLLHADPLERAREQGRAAALADAGGIPTAGD